MSNNWTSLYKYWTVSLQAAAGRRRTLAAPFLPLARG